MRLVGITWNHDRGLAPMLATARRFAELHPGTTIEWKVRSLQEFADASVESLARQFDLIILDHPSIGQAARHGDLLPLDEYIAAADLASLAASSVGASHASYNFDGRQWALAIDAAAQVAGFRADLLEAAGAQVPRTWDEVLALASFRPGFVTIPLLPVDALMCFFTLCANCGNPPFAKGVHSLVDREAGMHVMGRLETMARFSAAGSLSMNPIALWERMSETDEIGYCPLAFGYSNYARPGYRRSLVAFTNIPSTGSSGPAGATLGGAGLAISRRSGDPKTAVEYALWVASEECQQTIYVRSGGQPAHRQAWTSPDANLLTNNFFKDTLPTLEKSFLRPRGAGFIEFQTRSAALIAAFLRGERTAGQTLDLMDECYAGWNASGLCPHDSKASSGH